MRRRNYNWLLPLCAVVAGCATLLGCARPASPPAAAPAAPTPPAATSGAPAAPASTPSQPAASPPSLGQLKYGTQRPVADAC